MFRNNSKMNLILRDGEIERRNMTNKVDKAWKKEVEQSILTHRASELPSLNINIKKWASPTPTPCSPGEGGQLIQQLKWHTHKLRSVFVSWLRTWL